MPPLLPLVALLVASVVGGGAVPKHNALWGFFLPPVCMGRKRLFSLSLSVLLPRRVDTEPGSREPGGDGGMPLSPLFRCVMVCAQMSSAVGVLPVWELGAPRPSRDQALRGRWLLQEKRGRVRTSQSERGWLVAGTKAEEAEYAWHRKRHRAPRVTRRVCLFEVGSGVPLTIRVLS